MEIQKRFESSQPYFWIFEEISAHTQIVTVAEMWKVPFVSENLEKTKSTSIKQYLYRSLHPQILCICHRIIEILHIIYKTCRKWANTCSCVCAMFSKPKCCSLSGLPDIRCCSHFTVWKLRYVATWWYPLKLKRGQKRLEMSNTRSRYICRWRY